MRANYKSRKYQAKVISIRPAMSLPLTTDWQFPLLKLSIGIALVLDWGRDTLEGGDRPFPFLYPSRPRLTVRERRKFSFAAQWALWRPNFGLWD
jgi:hypothetical protein